LWVFNSSSDDDDEEEEEEIESDHSYKDICEKDSENEDVADVTDNDKDDVSVKSLKSSPENSTHTNNVSKIQEKEQTTDLSHAIDTSSTNVDLICGQVEEVNFESKLSEAVSDISIMNPTNGSRSDSCGAVLETHNVKLL